MPQHELVFKSTIGNHPFTILTSQESGAALDQFSELCVHAIAGTGSNIGVQFTADGGATWVTTDYSRAGSSETSSVSADGTETMLHMHSRSALGAATFKHLGLPVPKYGYGQDGVASFSWHIWGYHPSPTVYNGIKLWNAAGTNPQVWVTGRRKDFVNVIKVIDLPTEFTGLGYYEILTDGQGRPLDKYQNVQLIFDNVAAPNGTGQEGVTLRRKSTGTWITSGYKMGYWSYQGEGRYTYFRWGRSGSGFAPAKHTIVEIWGLGGNSHVGYRMLQPLSHWYFGGNLIGVAEPMDGIRFDWAGPAPTSGKCYVVGEFM